MLSRSDDELVLVLHLPVVPECTVVKPESYVIVHPRGPSRAASQFLLPNRKLSVSMIGCKTKVRHQIPQYLLVVNFLILWIDQNPVELITCGGEENRRNTILLWIFTVDKWMRGQQVKFRRRGRQ